MVFPPYKLPLKEEKDQQFIWDVIRKRWMCYTPEEEVRQRLLLYLLQEKNVPPSLIAVEKQIQLYERKKRFDVVVFNKEGMPFILCECKAPHIAISQETCYQIGQYNLVLKAPFLLLTNGENHFFFEVKPDGTYDPQVF